MFALGRQDWSVLNVDRIGLNAGNADKLCPAILRGMDERKPLHKGPAQALESTRLHAGTSASSDSREIGEAPPSRNPVPTCGLAFLHSA